MHIWVATVSGWVLTVANVTDFIFTFHWIYIIQNNVISFERNLVILCLSMCQKIKKCERITTLLKRVSWPNKKKCVGDRDPYSQTPFVGSTLINGLLGQHIDMCVMWANKSLVDKAQLFVDITRSPIAALTFKIVFLHKFWVELTHPKRVISASLNCSLNTFQLLFQHLSLS